MQFTAGSLDMEHIITPFEHADNGTAKRLLVTILQENKS